MVYEARKHAFHFKNIPYEGKKLEDTERPFGSDVWINDAKRSVTSYQDAHCWAFTTKGFISVMEELRRGGYFNFDIIDIDEHSMTASGHCNEFYIKLRPTSPAHSEPPKPQSQIASPSNQKYYELYHATVNSTSWKLTRPLRAIKRFLT